MRSIFKITCFFLCYGSVVLGQISPSLLQAYQQVGKLRVGVAKQYLAKEKNNKEPQNQAFVVYVENYADMVQLLVSDDATLFSEWAARQDQRLASLDQLPNSGPWQRWAKAEVRLHWAFVKLKFGKEISASWDIIKAYKLLDENARLFPSFVPTYKSLGLLHVLVGSAPQNYQWVAKWLGLRGNIQQGLRELNQVVQQDATFRTEAQLIQILLHAYVLKYSEKQNDILTQLIQNQTDNLLLHFFGATVSMKDGRGQQALQWLESRPTGAAYLPFPFLTYLRAEILLQKGEYATAEQQFQAFLGQYRGQNFLKDTQWKLFLCQWLANNDAAAQTHIKKVLTVGQTVVEADKAAQRFAEDFLKNRVTPSQKILLKARLAFDGGYLDEALQLLKPLAEAQFAQMRHRAEFNYRLGRVHQRRNDPEAAIPRYERAIALSQAEHYSFGATAALQLGYIYQLKNQPQKAATCFRAVLNYPKHEYKNSTDNKARAALTEMGMD